MKKNISFTVGICAYNEEKTIGTLIQFLLKEKFKKAKMKEIIIVASGCTDQTEKIVRQYSRQEKRIKLIREKERKGKSSAVNLIIKNAKYSSIVLISADVLPAEGAIEKLILALQKPEVGMVGGRPVPFNHHNNLVGFAVNLQWLLHHHISLQRAKVGEMAAFKKIFTRINPKSAVDEAIVECLVAMQGYQIIYEPKAIVYNHGPKTIRDFLRQRRRIYAGHLATKKHYGYAVSTFEIRHIFPYLVEVMKPDLKFILYTPLVAGLEIVARCAGWMDFHFKIRDHAVWKIASSSKSIYESK